MNFSEFVDMKNVDPRWTEEHNAIIEQKVKEAMRLPKIIQIKDQSTGTEISEDLREAMLRANFREIVKATSFDLFIAAPPMALLQMSTISSLRGEKISHILTHFMQVMITMLSMPETYQRAMDLMQLMDMSLGQHVQRLPQKPDLMFKWGPLPGLVTTPARQADDAGAKKVDAQAKAATPKATRPAPKPKSESAAAAVV